MSLLNRKVVAWLVALPALLIPAIEIPLVLWARANFLASHGADLDQPPTISRAITDPIIGTPFANLILVINGLLLIVMPLLFWAYTLAIWQLSPARGGRIVMFGLLLLVFVSQVIASIGMVVTTQYTFATDDRLHMLGSYYFFTFQALTVVFAAALCRLLLARKLKLGIADADWQFRAATHRFRFRFGLLITALAILYGVLFMIKDDALPISEYAMHVIYTQCEVVVIGAFVLFLGSYAVDLHHMVRNDRLRPGAPGRTAISDTPREPSGR